MTESMRLALSTTTRRLHSRSGDVWAVVLAILCGSVLYFAITAFDRPTTWYHAQVSYHLVLAAALLSLPFLLFPSLRTKPVLIERWPWLVVTLCFIMATWLSVDPLVSVSRLRLIFSVVLLAMVVKMWLERSSRIVVSLLLLSFAAVHAAILTLVLYSYAFASGDLGDFTTWLPYHSHIRHLGYHGAIAACCGLAFAVLQPNFRLVGGFFSTYALFGLIYFGSRGALLTWVVFVVVCLALSFRRRSLLLSAGICLAVAWGSTNAINKLKDSHIGTVADRSISTASVDSRIHLWTDSLGAVAKRPWLGYGPEGYFLSRCCAPGHIQAHNSILQIVIEVGILGLLALLWLGWVSLGKEFLRLARRRFRHQDVEPERIVIASLIISLLAYSLLDGLFYHVIPLMIFSIFCALFFSLQFSLDKEDSVSRLHHA